MKKILITGGAGFIGSNLVRFFNTHSPDVEVIVVDDLSSGSLQNLTGMDCDLHEYSILDNEQLRKSAHGVDSIVHLAAIGSVPRSVANPLPTHHANVTGTLNVLEVARDIRSKHIVVASSSSVYGGNPALPKRETDWTRPLSPYGASKLATEAYSLAYQTSYGLRTLAFRFFNVYGPNQRADHDYAAVIPRFVDAALRGQPLSIYGDGTQSRDFTYVESVCSALHASALKTIRHSQPVNLAFGTNTSLLELIQIIGGKLHRTLEVAYQDKRVGDVRASQADPSLFRELLPAIEPATLDFGISKTIEWFMNRPAK